MTAATSDAFARALNRVRYLLEAGYMTSFQAFAEISRLLAVESGHAQDLARALDRKDLAGELHRNGKDGRPDWWDEFHAHTSHLSLAAEALDELHNGLFSDYMPENEEATK